MDPSADNSSMSIAGTPMAMVDEKEKKKFMKTEIKHHE